MSELLHFSEHRLQEGALLFMAIVYFLRIRWLLGFKAGGDRQAPTGAPDTTPWRGSIISWANIATPWAMESTRRHFGLYLQFVMFHLGVVTAIGLSFIIPYAPGWLDNAVFVRVIQLITIVAFIIGIIRIIRRMTQKVMRAISTPDDYFSLTLLIIWFFFATLAAPNDILRGETPLLAFFILTAFFLVYVPFSKISHYLYYPFTRYYIGKTLGHRGVYPIVHRVD